jgi:hypothetical protein
MPDLELATVDEVFDELSKRFDGVLLAYTKRSKTSDNEDVFSCQYAGGLVQAIGLAAMASAEISAKTQAMFGGDEE